MARVIGGRVFSAGYFSIIVFVCLTTDVVFGVTHYSVPEEMEEGAVVANLAADLGLDVKALTEKRMRIDSGTNKKYLDINKETGELVVLERIDREILCPNKTTTCFLKFSATIENPVGIFNIEVEVTDINDNRPEIVIESFQSSIEENEPIDTVIAVVSVNDKDSGNNGMVVVYIPPNLPFKLHQSSSDNYIKLVVSEPLDREKVPEYDITFTVLDTGSPRLSDNVTMTLELLDVNDNVPQFPQSFYTIRVLENNAPGALLGSLTAFDLDLHENQYLVYFILEKEIANTSMSMLFSINPENGNLYTLKTFDYEIEKEFLFHIEARDSGAPPLSSNVTVHIIIVDQNDNTPVIVSPSCANGSVVEGKIPRSTDKGSLVAKVIALDTDSVHNSRITYQFLQVTDATLFSLDQYNGEIRTMRMFSYRDPRHQQLVVVAKDNGQPSLSATVTIKLSTVETAVKTDSDMTEEPLNLQCSI